jgi:cytidine deaminase
MRSDRESLSAGKVARTVAQYQGIRAHLPDTPWFGDTKEMNEVRSTLIAAATAVCGAFSWGEHGSAGSVGAAILTAKGNIYTGICIDLACGLGFCAEVAAVADMLKARERHVLAVVAVSKRGVLFAPCGRCRETIAQVEALSTYSR